MQAEGQIFQPTFNFSTFVYVRGETFWRTMNHFSNFTPLHFLQLDPPLQKFRLPAMTLPAYIKQIQMPTRPSTPDWLDSFLVDSDSVYTHICKWRGFVWYLSVPLSKQRSFWRLVDAHVHFSPEAEIHQVSQLAHEIERWAEQHIIETGDPRDRIAAADIANAFRYDTAHKITARALGDVLSRVLNWNRIKSHGNMVYTGVKLAQDTEAEDPV